MLKNLTFVLFALMALTASAQTYWVKPELQYSTPASKVYETLSGLTIKTDVDCLVSNYTQARLRYDGTTTDRLIYTENEYFIDLEGNLDSQEVEAYCKVLGVIGVGVSNIIYIENNTIYDTVGERLYLYNVRLFDGVVDMGTLYRSAILKLTDGLFEIQELSQ